MSILFAANRSPTGHALALAVHQNADGRWYWFDGDNREIALAQGEDLYATAEDAKIAAHKRWKCSDRGGHRRSPTPLRVGVSALLLASLALASSADAAPRHRRPSASKLAKERFVLSCVDERTGPTGGLELEDAMKLCRSIVRHQAKIAHLADLAAKARAQNLPRLALKVTAECAEEVSIACEDTTDRAVDHGECSDATLEAKHAFDVCRAKGGK